MRAFLSCFDKFRNTSLKHRLVALDIGNYAVGLRARFALSCEISLCKKFCFDKFRKFPNK